MAAKTSLSAPSTLMAIRFLARISLPHQTGTEKAILFASRGRGEEPVWKPQPLTASVGSGRGILGTETAIVIIISGLTLYQVRRDLVVGVDIARGTIGIRAASFVDCEGECLVAGEDSTRKQRSSKEMASYHRCRSRVSSVGGRSHTCGDQVTDIRNPNALCLCYHSGYVEPSWIFAFGP
jgi:hypothetical protein